MLDHAWSIMSYDMIIMIIHVVRLGSFTLKSIHLLIWIKEDIHGRPRTNIIFILTIINYYGMIRIYRGSAELTRTTICQGATAWISTFEEGESSGTKFEMMENDMMKLIVEGNIAGFNEQVTSADWNYLFLYATTPGGISFNVFLPDFNRLVMQNWKVFFFMSLQMSSPFKTNTIES